MKLGPLGFPRLTAVGPLVSDSSSFSEGIDNQELDNIFNSSIRERNYNPRDLSPDEAAQLAQDALLQIYPEDNPVAKAKRARLANCVQNKWAEQWAIGLADNTDTANKDNDAEMLRLRFKGCVGVTESNVPDDVRLIPEQFK